MSSVWDQKAEAYRKSEEHRQGRERVRELLADRIDNGLYRLDRVALKGRKAA